MAGGDRRWKVLVLGNVGSEGLDLLRDVAELTVLPEPVSVADIAACIEDMDAVLHKTGRNDAGVMSRQARLQIIARHGVGLDELDLDSIRRAGVPVSTTPGANSNAVAEATVGMALNVLRHLPRSEAMIKRDRAWKRESLMGRELGQAVVGIVGFGRIGRLAARYFAVFGARVIVTDVDIEAVADSPYPAVGLEELLVVDEQAVEVAVEGGDFVGLLSVSDCFVKRGLECFGVLGDHLERFAESFDLLLYRGSVFPGYFSVVPFGRAF